MNPAILNFVLTVGAKVLDRVLTEEKVDPNGVEVEGAPKKRQVSVKKASRSLVVTGIGAVLYLVVQAGYISPASMQCMIDAAAEVEAKVQQEQTVAE